MRRNLARSIVLLLVLVLCALPTGAAPPEQQTASRITEVPTGPVYRSPNGHAGAGGWRGPVVPGAVPEPNGPMVRVAPWQGARTGQAVAPCSAGDCSSATAIACNSVVTLSPTTDQWDTYPCLDTTYFSSLPNPEALLKHTVSSANLDIGMAVPLGTSGNEFAAILGSCDNTDCLSAGHTKDFTFYQHAIVADAAVKDYDLVVETSDDPDFTAAVLLSCGTHNTGWCAARVRRSISPGTNTVISDTTKTGHCDVIKYNAWNYAFDGNEVVYSVPLTRSAIVSVTLDYAGDPLAPYYTYMAAQVLTGDCNQRNVWMSTYLVGDTGYTSSWVWDMLPADTYYIVVDGMSMPCSGNPYTLTVTVQNRVRWLPILYQQSED